jgi:hypothetical protein
MNHMMRWVAGSGMAGALALVAFFALKDGNAPPVPTALAKHNDGVRNSPSDEARVHKVSSAQPIDHPAHSAERATDKTSAAAWGAKFHAADDYSRFIKEALPAARAGDGRAAWYISKALRECAYVVHEYRGSADPEAQLLQELASMPNAPEWSQKIRVEHTHRCLGIAREAPATGLPTVDGHPSSYWYAQAVAAGDPIAQAAAAADAVGEVSASNGTMSDAQKADKLKTAEKNLRAAVESGDVDALYYAGELLTNTSALLGSDPLQGIAMALAACQMGRDCSPNNPDDPGYDYCKATGDCSADTDYAYRMQRDLGPDLYGQVYANAQVIEQAARAHDWNAVLANLAINKR